MSRWRNNYDPIDPKTYLLEQYQDAQRALQQAQAEAERNVIKTELPIAGVTSAMERASDLFKVATGNTLDYQHSTTPQPDSPIGKKVAKVSKPFQVSLDALHDAYIDAGLRFSLGGKDVDLKMRELKAFAEVCKDVQKILKMTTEKRAK
jgi:hypothetical protein